MLQTIQNIHLTAEQEDKTMIQIISGEKGKGKTKYLLEKVNNSVQNAKGNLVFLDKNNKHMYELNNKVRLINVLDLPVKNSDEFLGFLCGLISQDNDLEEVYFDSFLTIAHIQSDEEISKAISRLEELSEKYSLNFTLSISRDEKNLPDSIKEYIAISL